ncbi:Peroxisome biosynthesis protein pex1, partial [Linderina macrospora]
RADILQRQATKLKVSDEVDWKNIASRTEDFTGADLQALVYNAFLESVHEMTDKHKAVTAGAGTSDGDDELKHAEFAVAKSSAKPLSAVEKTQMAERLYRLLINSDPTSTHDSSAKKSMDAAELESLTPVVSMAHFEAAFKVTQSSLGEQDRVKFEGIYRDFVDDKKGSGDKPRKPVEQKATMA